MLRREGFYTERELRWFGPGGAAPDWGGPNGILGCSIASMDGVDASQSPGLCLLFNATPEAARFELPGLPQGRRWRVAVDTSASPPADVRAPGDESVIEGGGAFGLQAHAFVLMVEGSA